MRCRLRGSRLSVLRWSVALDPGEVAVVAVARQDRLVLMGAQGQEVKVRVAP